MSVKLPYDLPVMSRFNYWIGFAHLTKFGKRIAGKAEEHKFKSSLGTFLYDASMKALLKYCKKKCKEQTEDIQIRVIQAEDVTPKLMAEIRANLHPVLIKGAAKNWPAYKSFNLEFFEERYGQIEVPINEEPNKVFEDNGKPVPMSNFYKMRYVPIKELIESVRNNGNLSAKAIEDIMHVNNGELINNYCDINHIHDLSGYNIKKNKWYNKKYPIGKVISDQLFLQPERSHTLWHVEPGDNFFVQLQGKKRWRFVHPMYTPGMYPVVKEHSAYHASRVDGRESNDVIDRRGFPLYKYVPKYTADVEAGDILFMPNYWWHTVNNLPGSHTISMTFRTISEVNTISPTWGILRLLDPTSWKIRKKMLKHGRLFDEDISASLFAYADDNGDISRPSEVSKVPGKA